MAGEALTSIPGAIDAGQRQRRDRIARWPPRDHRMRAGRGGTAHDLPDPAGSAQRIDTEVLLQAALP